MNSAIHLRADFDCLGFLSRSGSIWYFSATTMVRLFCLWERYLALHYTDEMVYNIWTGCMTKLHVYIVSPPHTITNKKKIVLYLWSHTQSVMSQQGGSCLWRMMGNTCCDITDWIVAKNAAYFKNSDHSEPCIALRDAWIQMKALAGNTKWVQSHFNRMPDQSQRFGNYSDKRSGITCGGLLSTVIHCGVRKTIAGVQTPLDPDVIIIVYRFQFFIQTWISVAGPKELMKNISLSENLKWFQCTMSFYQTSLLVCFRGFICFKLREESSTVVSCLCITTLKPCHWFISPEIKVTLMCIIQSHSFLAPAVQAARQLCCCTVDAQCNFSMYYHLWEWELFINIPFYGQYSTIYLYVLFSLCQSVHLNYIVHMQMIWTLCFRIYCLFCTWWLICTPTSPAPPPSCSIHIVVIFLLWWCGHIKWRNMF